MTTDDRPTCDLSGCDQPGFARYRHASEDRWIDVCAPHRPGGQKGLARLSYHTVHNKAYPADIVSQVFKGHRL